MNELALIKTLSWQNKLLCFFAPLLFLVFFSHQAYLVFFHDFSVWKGGGMGMFSSPDHPSKRTLFYYITTESGEEFQIMPDFLTEQDLYGDFTVLPTPKLLQEVQESFMGSTWYVTHQEGNKVWVTNRPTNDTISVIVPTDVRIVMWKMTDIDAQRNTYTYEEVHNWETANTKYEE